MQLTVLYVPECGLTLLTVSSVVCSSYCGNCFWCFPGSGIPLCRMLHSVLQNEWALWGQVQAIQEEATEHKVFHNDHHLPVECFYDSVSI